MSRERRVVSPEPFGREHHENTASVARHGLTPDQTLGFDPVDQPGDPAPREKGSLLDVLDAQGAARGVVEA